VNCKKFPEICLKELRHISQQRADILNIFYDGEYSINYYIWLIIEEKSKQCVLTVPAARSIFIGKWRSGFAGSCRRQNQYPISLRSEHPIHYHKVTPINVTQYTCSRFYKKHAPARMTSTMWTLNNIDPHELLNNLMS
jgi:hypothetical protein